MIQPAGRALCVLLVKSEGLLSAGIESLLRNQAELLVQSIAPINEATLIREIRRICPDVIIVDQSYATGRLCQFISRLQECPQVRLMVVNDHHSLIQVYGWQQVIISRAADLVGVIRQVGG